MQFHPSQTEPRTRCFPVLSFFDVSLNLALSIGVFSLGCCLLGVVLSNNAPRLLAQATHVASHILSYT